MCPESADAAILEKGETSLHAHEFFGASRHAIFRHTDRLFAVLILSEWLAAIVTAVVVSPRAWAGASSWVHLHVWASLGLGGGIASLPVALALIQPGRTATRHVIATAQMLMGGLLIHLTGGRIETHFYVFASLALLAFYRDWRVLVSASAIVVLDHILRGLYWPRSVYGVPFIEPWRWIEHAGWVVIEDAFLIQSCLRSVREMRAIAERQADLARANEVLQQEIAERKRAERELQEQTRLSTLGSDVGLALTRDISITEQLRTCTEALVRHLDAACARIWTMESGGDSLELRASCGLDTHLDGTQTRIAVGSRIAGRIRVPLHPLLLNDVAEDPSIGDDYWARRERIVAFAGHPLLAQNRLLGVMVVFSRQALNEATFEAMGTVANAVALGIERELDAAALRASESRKTSILQTALDAIVIMDEQDRVLEFNPAAEATFGYTAAKALGRPMDELIILTADHETTRLGPHRYRLTREGRMMGRRLEVTATRRDGTEFPAELAITPIHSGDTTVFTGYIRDITERKGHEESLRRAKEQAEEANRAKSRFLANMSHEIRTPLTAVIGFAEVLRRGVDDESERREYVETIASSGGHLLTVIDDILDLSKIEAGRMECRRLRASPHRVLSEVISILRVRAAEKGLSLECGWEGRVPESIVTDPDRLRQLLMNLIGNAIKFTDKGGVLVSASLARETSEPRLLLEVRDTGIGIAEEHIEKIFSPFDQADGSITRRFGGTGLGLAISRHIAQALGGDVTVASKPGEGSRFRATIATGPLEGVTIWDRPPAEALRPTGQVGGSSTHLDGIRILLVEDGVTNRKLIGLLLRRAGAEVTCAEDGRAGVEAATSSRFDLILMDMQMPILDGYEATRQIRAAGYGGPILALTAHALRGEAESCLAAGCDAHLAKPIDHDVLLATVRGRLPEPASERRSSKAVCGEPVITSSLPTDDPEFREIVEEFAATLHEKVHEMRESWEHGDRQGLARLAHWLKGAGGTAGFDTLTEPARRLGHDASRGTIADVENALLEIEALARRIVVPPAMAI